MLLVRAGEVRSEKELRSWGEELFSSKVPSFSLVKILQKGTKFLK